jgi:hypothetical protein
LRARTCVGTKSRMKKWREPQNVLHIKHSCFTQAKQLLFTQSACLHSTYSYSAHACFGTSPTEHAMLPLRPTTKAMLMNVVVIRL